MAIAGHAFVEPVAATKHGIALRGRQARPVIVDDELDAVALAPRRDDDEALGPFAGIVREIAQHLFEILALAAKTQARRQPRLDADPPIDMDTLERAPQILGHRVSFGAHPQNASGGSGPRAGEITIDLLAHRRGLPLDR